MTKQTLLTQLNPVSSGRSLTDTQVEALVKDDGSVITDNTKIEEILFETFYKGKHIVNNQSSFDAKLFEDTNTLYKFIIDNEFTNSSDDKDRFQHSSALYNPISEQEVCSTIKDNKSAAGSFDNCKVHPLMLKYLNSDAIYALTRLFNLRLRNGKKALELVKHSLPQERGQRPV